MFKIKEREKKLQRSRVSENVANRQHCFGQNQIVGGNGEIGENEWEGKEVEWMIRVILLPPSSSGTLFLRPIPIPCTYSTGE